jgi:hypothetical protein
MNWYFDPHHEPDESPAEDASAPGLTCLPAALLQRHGARVLDPVLAAAVPGEPAPRPTVYRANTLLVPRNLMATERMEINRVLARAGMALVGPGEDTAATDGSGQSRHGDVFAQLPRRAVLAPAAPADGTAALPVVVDAWVALQALRAAATAGHHQHVDAELVSRISLEHLLVGSAISGNPITDGGGLTGNPITDGGGITGPGSTDSYMYGGGDARSPVELCVTAPRRNNWEDCVSWYGRRPVIAVLDTGVRTHPWLEVETDSSAPGGYRATVPDGFVAVDMDMQHIIHQEAEQVAGTAGQPHQLIRYPWDRPLTAEPLVGELDTHTGHGTFIAGIVRQVVPDAQVLAIRIMHSDGIVYEGDLMCALGLLASRVASALDGDMSQMVDVVSLSLGYFSETAADETYSSGLWQVIGALLTMGVVVTAAAGNYATSRRFYPAAFAGLAPTAGQVPLISVGALNPNGSKALFSDGGSWIRAWACGAAMISTFPADINGSRDPAVSLPAHPANSLPVGLSQSGERAALDPDDYSGGFAVWSGTSFSAPLVAAHVARELLTGAAADNGLRLDQNGAGAAVGRVMQALHSLGWPG